MSVVAGDAIESRPSEAHPLLSPQYRTRLLCVLLLVNTLNFADRAVLSAAIEPMRRELALSDTQIGLLQGAAFGLVYALASLPVGVMADRFSRRLLLALSTASFSVMSGACGLATNFVQLFVARTGVGAGEAAFMPSALSLLADHVKASRRASAIALINLGSPFGFLLGSAVGGLIVAHWGWRAVFFASVVPGLVVACGVLVALKEPLRGLADGTGSARRVPATLRQAVTHLFGCATFRHLVAGSALVLLGSYGIVQFMFSFLMRTYALAPAQAGLMMGGISFVAISIGTLTGGFSVDQLRPRDVRWSTWVPMIGALASCLLYALAFVGGPLWLAILGLTAGGAALFSFYAPAYGLIQALSPAPMRGAAIGIVAVIFGVVGAGVGPTVAGLLSDAFAGASLGSAMEVCRQLPKGAVEPACDRAQTEGLRSALLTLCAFFAWGGMHFWRAGQFVQRDLKSVQLHHG